MLSTIVVIELRSCAANEAHGRRTIAYKSGRSTEASVGLPNGPRLSCGACAGGRTSVHKRAWCTLAHKRNSAKAGRRQLQALVRRRASRARIWIGKVAWVVEPVSEQ